MLNRQAMMDEIVKGMKLHVEEQFTTIPVSYTHLDVYKRQVYDLLDFKKDAYELLCQIGNRSDKKTLKRLGTLKEYALIRF